jgi:hypothetical protein
MGPTVLLLLWRKCMLQIFITHKNPLSWAGPELTAASPIVPMASMLTTRPPIVKTIMSLEKEEINVDIHRPHLPQKKSNQGKISDYFLKK